MIPKMTSGVNKAENDDSGVASRKDSGFPSSRSSLSSITSIAQSDLSPDGTGRMEPEPEPEPAPVLKLSKNAEQVLINEIAYRPLIYESC